MLLWTFNSISTLAIFYISKGLVRYLEMSPSTFTLSLSHNWAQDWWNVIVWDNPGLLHPLPCGFNYQTAEQLNYGPWKKVLPRIYLKTVLHCSSANFRCLTLSIVAQQFDAYHACPETVMIRHGQVYSNLWCCVHSLSSIKTISRIFIYPWATVMSIVINAHFDLHHFWGMKKFNDLCEMVH